jgi:uncharacterized membrane protein YdbT with pleckstrin-like domain
VPALLPDERQKARRRQSKVVLLSPPHKLLTAALLVLLIMAIAQPRWMVVVLLLVVLAIGVWRVLNWQAEWILLTDKRIIRTAGLPETTTVEAFLRVDRISGVVLVQSVFGRLCGYGTIHIEASGSHPTLRTLEKVADVGPFYLILRDAVFGTKGVDPDEEPADYVTAELPVLPPPRDRFGRRQDW